MALPWDFSSDHCPVVYHYTSIEAARAIVENRTFRLSEYTALNDASEFSYARDRLIGLMRDRQVYTDLTTRIFVVSELEGLPDNAALVSPIASASQVRSTVAAQSPSPRVGSQTSG